MLREGKFCDINLEERGRELEEVRCTLSLTGYA
jgi:hypothetical protein